MITKALSPYLLTQRAIMTAHAELVMARSTGEDWLYLRAT